MKYPKDFSKTGTFGNLTVSDTTDYSISATTLTGQTMEYQGSTAVDLQHWNFFLYRGRHFFGSIKHKIGHLKCGL